MDNTTIGKHLLKKWRGLLMAGLKLKCFNKKRKISVIVEIFQLSFCVFWVCLSSGNLFIFLVKVSSFFSYCCISTSYINNTILHTFNKWKICSILSQGVWVRTTHEEKYFNLSWHLKLTGIMICMLAWDTRDLVLSSHFRLQFLSWNNKIQQIKKNSRFFT